MRGARRRGDTAGRAWENRPVRTLVFIPAWNEEDSVGGVIAGVRDSLPDADLLVVDDGSTDDTAARARAAGALVASLPFNQGVGAAQQTGYLYALREGYDICAQTDGDGQHPPQELARVVAQVREGNADMAIGSRYLDPDIAQSGDYQASPMRGLGIRVFRAIVSASTHQRFTDTTSGLRALNRSAMALFVERLSSEFADVESLQRAVHQGLRVKEIPVRMLPRAGGDSFLNPLGSLYYIYKTLVVLLGRPRAAARILGEPMSTFLLAAQDAEPVIRLTTQARIVAAILAIAFMALIFELIRRHRLQERYAIIWFLAGIGMLFGAAFPQILEVLARAMGVRDVTIALFSLILFVLLILSLSFTVILSRQANQITRLAQESAIERLRQEREEEGDGAASGLPEQPA